MIVCEGGEVVNAQRRICNNIIRESVSEGTGPGKDACPYGGFLLLSFH